MRLDKYLSNAGYGSRSQVKKLIKTGSISVNGIVCTDPSRKIALNASITFDDEPVTSKPESTIMLNKPKGYVSSTENEAGYPSVIDLIAPPHPEYSIAGRLDVDTTGLIILSTQGDLIHSIISPSKGVSKIYEADVIHFNPVTSQSFLEGMDLSGSFQTKPVTHFEVISHNNGITTIQLGITEGKFHQVKRMFQHVQAEVIRLERIAIGSLKLDPCLSQGDYRELSQNEIQLIFRRTTK